MLFTCAREGFENVLNRGREGFGGEKNPLALFLAVLLWLALLLIAAQFLWNKVLVNLVTVVKPVTSVFQVLHLL